MSTYTNDTDQIISQYLASLLNEIDKSDPHYIDKMLPIIERLAVHEKEKIENALKRVEYEKNRSLWRSNTPVVIFVTGILTICANFVVSYILKDQESHSFHVSKEVDFQYSIVEKIMSSSSIDELEDDEIEKKRARQLLFLSRIGLLPLVKNTELEALAAETLGEKDAGPIGFPTLPRIERVGRTTVSSLTLPTRSLLSEVLGPPGTVCPIPLAQLPVPFVMVYAFDESTVVEHINVHEGAVEYFQRAFSLISALGLQEQARLFGGTYVPRNVRGGSVPSLYAWGVSISFKLDAQTYTPGSEYSAKYEMFIQTMEGAGFRVHVLDPSSDWINFDLSAEALENIRSNGYRPDLSRCK